MAPRAGLRLESKISGLGCQTEQKRAVGPKGEFSELSNPPLGRPPDPEKRSPAPAATGHGGDRNALSKQQAEYHRQPPGVHYGTIRKSDGSEIRIARYGLGKRSGVSIRHFSHRGGGVYEPTSRGFTFKLAKLPEFLEILQRAAAKVEGQP